MSNETTLRSRAEVVTRLANVYLRERFGDALDRAIAVGLNGSCARNELTPVSDIDYCVIFECTDGALDGLTLAKVADDLGAHIRGALPHEPFARRFSVFWSCRRHLSIGGCHEGRFPAYDRGLFRDHGKVIAGRELDRACLREPSELEVGQSGVRFLLDEVRPQLATLGLFEKRGPLTPELVMKLGPVLASKAVLMPLRLLYTLLPESRGHRFIGAEAAVNACRGRYGTKTFWPLAEEAVGWRSAFPGDEASVARVGVALGGAGRDLYRECVEVHHAFAVRNDMTAAVHELAAWREQLTS